jgi:hypothetical protein
VHSVSFFCPNFHFRFDARWQVLVHSFLERTALYGCVEGVHAVMCSAAAAVYE